MSFKKSMIPTDNAKFEEYIEHSEMFYNDMMNAVNDGGFLGIGKKKKIQKDAMDHLSGSDKVTQKEKYSQIVVKEQSYIPITSEHDSAVRCNIVISKDSAEKISNAVNTAATKAITNFGKSLATLNNTLLRAINIAQTQLDPKNPNPRKISTTASELIKAAQKWQSDIKKLVSTYDKEKRNITIPFLYSIPARVAMKNKVIPNSEATIRSISFKKHGKGVKEVKAEITYTQGKQNVIKKQVEFDLDQICIVDDSHFGTVGISAIQTTGVTAEAPEEAATEVADASEAAEGGGKKNPNDDDEPGDKYDSSITFDELGSSHNICE